MNPDQPLVYRDMTQAALDAAYDQAVYAPNMAQVLARLATSSRQAREVLGDPLHFAYGPAGIEGLDVYRAAGAGKPVLIFVHGGTWRLGVAADNAFAAEHLVQTGVHLVVPDFSSVDDFNGDLAGLVDQLRRAVQWVYAHAADFGGDPHNLYLAGFSSGAHLAGVLLTTDWTALALPADVFKGALLCSGMYDLKPVALSWRRQYLNLNPDTMPGLSPVTQPQSFTMPTIVAYGTAESPEFQRQAREFAAVLQAAGQPVTLVDGEAYNHFEIIETLGSPEGVLGRAIHTLMHPS